MPGRLSEDTFSCIMILTMLRERQDHTCTIILCDMQNATADKSFLLCHIFSYLESDTQLLLKTNHNTSALSNAIALAAKTPTKPKSANCSNCNKLYYMHPYCIMPCSGMAGKTVEESKEHHWKDKEVRKTSSTPVTIMAPKHRVQVTTSAGQAYVMKVDDVFLSTGIFR
jgi:hypothetical protein